VNSPASSLRSDSEYEESDEEEEVEVPKKTPVSEAIFNRYQAQQLANSAIH
jgi:hypothetical protein